MPFCLLSCVVGSQITNFKKRCFSNCEHCKDTYQYQPQAIAQQTVSMATTSFRTPQQTVSMATISSRAPTLKSNARRVKVPRVSLRCGLSKMKRKTKNGEVRSVRPFVRSVTKQQLQTNYYFLPFELIWPPLKNFLSI